MGKAIIILPLREDKTRHLGDVGFIPFWVRRERSFSIGEDCVVSSGQLTNSIQRYTNLHNAHHVFQIFTLRYHIIYQAMYIKNITFLLEM